MTAHENVAVPLALAGEDDAFPIAAEELEAIGLGHRLTHYHAQLSGREQPRVAIARAIAPRPDLDRTSGVYGKSVAVRLGLGGCRTINKNSIIQHTRIILIMCNTI